ncbi:hypothetical protein QQP08_011187 [Theobroma cacao]|nr:hypothetical protein QQP08_011187 [Theobroma cacao]
MQLQTLQVTATLSGKDHMQNVSTLIDGKLNKKSFNRHLVSKKSLTWAVRSLPRRKLLGFRSRWTTGLSNWECGFSPWTRFKFLDSYCSDEIGCSEHSKLVYGITSNTKVLKPLP